MTKVGPEVKHGRPRRWGLQNPDTWINLALSIRLAESYPAGKDEGQTIWKRMVAAFIEPMQCTPVAAASGGTKRASRFKFDGYRCLAVKRAERSRRFSLAKKKVINRRFSPPAILHVVVPRALATTVHILPSKLARFGIVGERLLQPFEGDHDRSRL